MEKQTCMNADSGKSCGCVGYAYVPVQELMCVYSVDNAVRCGTLFPELALSINEYGKICKQWGDTSDE